MIFLCKRRDAVSSSTRERYRCFWRRRKRRKRCAAIFFAGKSLQFVRKEIFPGRKTTNRKKNGFHASPIDVSFLSSFVFSTRHAAICAYKYFTRAGEKKFYFRAANPIAIVHKERFTTNGRRLLSSASFLPPLTMKRSGLSIFIIREEFSPIFFTPPCFSLQKQH